MRWKEQKNSIKQKLREDLQRQALRECTFSPQINEESRLFNEETRGHGNQGVLGISERLYKAREFQERKARWDSRRDRNTSCYL